MEGGFISDEDNIKIIVHRGYSDMNNGAIVKGKRFRIKSGYKDKK